MILNPGVRRFRTSQKIVSVNASKRMHRNTMPESITELKSGSVESFAISMPSKNRLYLQTTKTRSFLEGNHVKNVLHSCVVFPLTYAAFGSLVTKINGRWPFIHTAIWSTSHLFSIMDLGMVHRKKHSKLRQCTWWIDGKSDSGLERATKLLHGPWI